MGASGALLLRAGDFELETPVVAYQRTDDDSRRPVAVAFREHAPERFGLDLAPHDRDRVLVVDPVLCFSTYLSGTVFDGAYAVVASGTPPAFRGQTTSLDCPIRNVLQPAYGGMPHDLFVAQTDLDGTPRFTTYLGGSNDE